MFYKSNIGQLKHTLLSKRDLDSMIRILVPATVLYTTRMLFMYHMATCPPQTASIAARYFAQATHRHTTVG